jgi:hypothetical protein
MRSWEPLCGGIADAIAPAPTDVTGVVARLHHVQGVLDAVPPAYGHNPVAGFNRLYTTVTEKVEIRLASGCFADPVFVTCLYVESARRYLDALRSWCRSSTATPECWRVLFSRIGEVEPRPRSGPVAGVHTHTTYDQPLALVATWAKLGRGDVGGRQHLDYQQINNVFTEVIPRQRRADPPTWQRFIDRVNRRSDGWHHRLLVDLARGLAWDDAAGLWPLRDDPAALGAAQATVDHRSAAVGRALLSPMSVLVP